MSLDHLHLIDDNLLAQVAFAPFIIDLMLNFVLIPLAGGVVLNVAQHHFR